MRWTCCVLFISVEECLFNIIIFLLTAMIIEEMETLAIE